MSRVGKQPVILPKGVKAKFENYTIFIEGPKGKLQLPVSSVLTLKIQEDKVIVGRANDEKKVKSLHGTIRALINNMVKGVFDGFKKDLEIIGVGYKAQLKGKVLVLNLGFSHLIEMPIPDELKVTLTGATKIAVEGIDKQRVGEFAAQIRKKLPPEPYKGKGIRYAGEEVKKKLGKALAKQ